MKTIFCTIILSLLAACGGGGGEQQTQSKPALIVFGNSITYMDAIPSRGWNHQSGMAASDQAHDFAHIAGTKLGLDVQALNVSSFEIDPINTGFVVESNAKQMVTSKDVVLVQMGDEVNPDQRDQFRLEYDRLLTSVAVRSKLICVSTWIADAELDYWMKGSCQKHGGTFVSIGDIRPNRTDVIQPGEDPGIAMRPHDPSMAVIGQRVAAAGK